MIYKIKFRDTESEYEMNTLSQAYYLFGEDYLIKDLVDELYPNLMTKENIGLLLDFLSDQYISYENVPLLKLVREMREWYEEQK